MTESSGFRVRVDNFKWLSVMRLIYKELEQIDDFSSEDTQSSVKEEKKGNLVGRFFEVIASTFTPIVPAIAGASLVKGILGLVTTLQWAPTDSDIVKILNIVADSVFYFLPFFLAVSAARKFKTNEFIALALASGLMYPTLIEGAQAIAGGGPEGYYYLVCKHVNQGDWLLRVVKVLLKF